MKNFKINTGGGSIKKYMGGDDYLEIWMYEDGSYASMLGLF